MLQSQLVEREQELHPAAKREVEPEEPQGFFARLERSALAADAEKVVAKGELRLTSCGVLGDTHGPTGNCLLKSQTFARLPCRPGHVGGGAAEGA